MISIGIKKGLCNDKCYKNIYLWGFLLGVGNIFVFFFLVIDLYNNVKID